MTHKIIKEECVKEGKKTYKKIRKKDPPSFSAKITMKMTRTTGVT